jgi:hypothetical protein
MAGLEILRHMKTMSGEQHHSYLAMRLLFSRVREMHAHLNRKFDAARDLFIRPRGRPAHDDYSVLPADVGLDRDGRGKSWSIREFTSRGREAARARGISRPNSQQAIHYGFAEAAQLRPLLLPDGKLPVLVRDALLDALALGEDRPEPAMIEWVNERVLIAVYRRLDDDNDRFNRWFLPGKGNLSKQLAGTKQTPGGIANVMAARPLQHGQTRLFFGYVGPLLIELQMGQRKALHTLV